MFHYAAYIYEYNLLRNIKSVTSGLRSIRQGRTGKAATRMEDVAAVKNIPIEGAERRHKSLAPETGKTRPAAP